MILVLYPERDKSSLWLVSNIRRICPEKPFVFISDVELIRNFKIEIKISKKNNQDSFILFNDLLKVHSDDISLCINMVTTLPEKEFMCFQKEDFSYIREEWYSIFLCILTILSNKMAFNKAKPYQFNGIDISSEKALLVAQKINLPSRRFVFSSEEEFLEISDLSSNALFFDLIVYENNCYADARLLSLLPVILTEKLTALLKHLDLKIIMLSLAFDRGQFLLLKVYSEVDYRVGGTLLIKKLLTQIFEFETV